jgi:hypothetical protein
MREEKGLSDDMPLRPPTDLSVADPIRAPMNVGDEMRVAGPSRSVTILDREIPFWLLALTFIVVSLLAYAPYLGSGFSADDFIFINMMEGAIPYNPWLGFWAVPADQFRGFTQLWWVATPPVGAFLRPLPSWTLTALYGVFGRNAIPFHVTSVLIHAAVALTAFFLLRRLSGRELPSLMAALFFLICEDHAMTVAWVTTITDLMCALFLNLALLCHVIAREERRPKLFAASLVFFLGAFASKETAAIYPVVIGIYELFFAVRLANNGEFSGRVGRIRLMLKSWWAWTIPLIVFGAYMVFYRSLLPPISTMMYVDPFSQPARYLATAIPNIPLMFIALLSQFLPSIALMVPGTLSIAAGLGLVLALLLVWALLPYRNQPVLWFSLVVFTLALLPGLATDPGERLLYYPSIFGFFPIAWLVLNIPAVKERFMPECRNGVRYLGPLLGWYLAVSSLVLPVALLVVSPAMWIQSMKVPEKTIVDSLPLIDDDVHEHVIFMNTNSSFNTFYLQDIYRFHRDRYVDLRVLSSFNGRVEARFEPPHTLDLRTEDIGWLSNFFARVIRVNPDFEVGDEFVTDTFTAEIQRVTPKKSDVMQVRFAFSLPLDHQSVVLLYWDGKRYQSWLPTGAWQPLNSTVVPYSF